MCARINIVIYTLSVNVDSQVKRQLNETVKSKGQQHGLLKRCRYGEPKRESQQLDLHRLEESLVRMFVRHQ